MVCVSLSPRLSRPPVADGPDGLQVWRIAANILNKQSRTSDRGWSSSLRVGQEAKNLFRNGTQGVARNFSQVIKEDSVSRNYFG